MRSHTRKMRIWVHLDEWLKWWNLIPRHISSIGIPGQLYKYCRAPMRHVLSLMANRIKHPLVRRWFCSHWRIHRGRVLRWCDSETGTKALCNGCFSHIHWDETARNFLTTLPNLLTIGHCWKLPKWPNGSLVADWWSSFAGKWLCKNNLPTRATKWLRYDNISWPKCPVKWARQESLMQLALLHAENESCM